MCCSSLRTIEKDPGEVMTEFLSPENFDGKSVRALLLI